jgi:hypothetical protein
MNKNIRKTFLYLLLPAAFISLIYFSIPKFFNYTTQLIEESLKKNSNFTIKDISNINYRLLPSPRLRVYGANLKLEENFLEVENAEIDIILNPLSLINYKRLNYSRLLIRGGSTNIEINKVNQLLSFVKKNKEKINLNKNTIIVLQKDKKIFEINDSNTNINSKNNTQQLSIEGLLSNYKINFFFKNKFKNKNNIILKIPDLDISTNISFTKKNNSKLFEGLVNFSVLNNFFQFNFIKKKNITIKKGFVRSNLIDTSFDGIVSFKPHFSFNLNTEPSRANIEKLYSIIKKNYFTDDPQRLEIIKKINGSLNFKTMYEGNITFKNSEVLFKNFKVNKKDPILFDAKISKLGKKGKIQFNLIKKIQSKRDITKTLKISGFIIPSSSELSFGKISMDEEIFTVQKTKKYEKKFKNEVIENSLDNIFNDIKLNNFFKSFI